MEIKNVSVLGFGDNVVDMYEHIRTMYPGGNCVNFSVYAKMAGAVKSGYMGYFGNDKAADHIVRTLIGLGIDLSYSPKLQGENGYSKVSLIDGDRVFGDYNEGGIRGKIPYILNDEHLEYMKGFDLVHSGNYSFTEGELYKIKEAGIPLSFDFSDDSDEDYYRQVAPFVTYAFCSKDGDDEAVKDHLQFIKSLGPEIVCASRGAKGCMLYDGIRFFTQQAIPLREVTDTTGAGDSLLTAFLVGYLDRRKRGMDSQAALEEAIYEAAVFASKICQIEGAFGFGVPYDDDMFKKEEEN